MEVMDIRFESNALQTCRLDVLLPGALFTIEAPTCSETAQSTDVYMLVIVLGDTEEIHVADQKTGEVFQFPGGTPVFPCATTGPVTVSPIAKHVFLGDVVDPNAGAPRDLRKEQFAAYQCAAGLRREAGTTGPTA